MDTRTVIASYATTLETLSAATARQRRWVLNRMSTDPELLRAPASELHRALDTWLSNLPPTMPLPTRAALTSAARQLLTHAQHHGLTPPGRPRWHLPAPTPTSTPPAHITALVAALSNDPPEPWPAALWARTRAHTFVLHDTGATLQAAANLTLDDLEPSGICLAATVHPLPIYTRVALKAWLEARTHLTSHLQGTPPTALWVRAHPARRPDGTLAAAGLPISDRGLRMAYNTTLKMLRRHDPSLPAIPQAHLRPRQHTS